MEDDQYKPLHKEGPIESLAFALASDIKQASRYDNPVMLGVLLNQLVQERENTNRIMKELLARIESLELKIEKLASAKVEVKSVQPDETMVGEADEKILSIAKALGKVCAEDVKNKLGYSGSNAASQRLNRLCDKGILEKVQAGRKKFFRLKS